MWVRQQLILNVWHDGSEQLWLLALVHVDQLGQIKHALGLQPVDLLNALHDLCINFLLSFLFVIHVVLATQVMLDWNFKWLLNGPFNLLLLQILSKVYSLVPLQHFLYCKLLSQLELLLFAFTLVLHGTFSLDNTLAVIDKFVDAILFNVLKVQPWYSQDCGELAKLFSLPLCLLLHFLSDRIGNLDLNKEELTRLPDFFCALLFHFGYFFF